MFRQLILIGLMTVPWAGADDVNTGESTPMSNTYYPGAVSDGTPYNASYDQPMPATSSITLSSIAPVAADGASYQLGQAPATKYGIGYAIWHCVTGGVQYNTYTNMAPLMGWNWHSQPSLGYYCPTQNPEVLRTHAVQLRDAGIDFIMIDMTNWTDANDPSTTLAVTDPFRVLLREWAIIPGAPKIVAILPLYAGATLPDLIDQIQTAYPKSFFPFLGKPLMLSWALSPPDPGLVAHLSAKYTIRNMYGPDAWQGLSPCRPGFKESGGTANCGQPVGYGPDGAVEDIPVSTAYQFSFMTAPDVVPRFGGLTFQAQMKRMDEFPDPPVVTITGWNQWIATRWCFKDGMQVDCTTPGASPTMPSGLPVFVDLYDDEHSNDIEPSTTYGDTYYRQMVTEIVGRKQARTAVIGYVDQAAKQTDGVGVVYGWACSSGYKDPITVELYANGPAGVGEFVAVTLANLESEEEVGLACQDGSQGRHRFGFSIPAAQMQRLGAQAVYVRGLSPVQKANFSIANSGMIDFTGKLTTGGTLAKNAGPIYRFYEPRSLKHFLTASYVEGLGAGMVWEGVGFRTPLAAAPNLVPLYRCYDGGNFLSLSASCEGHAAEGQIAWVSREAAAGLVKLYRLYNPQTGDHLATTSPDEAKSFGYRVDYALGYVLPQ